MLHQGQLIGAARQPVELVESDIAMAVRDFRMRIVAAVFVALLVVGLSRFGITQRSIDSVAVLPFENATSDPDAEYLGDGLTENLISQMSRVPSLKVMFAWMGSLFMIERQN